MRKHVCGHSDIANISKSSKLTAIDSLFAVYSHNSVQGLSGSFTLPCFTICKPHTQTQKCGPSSLLMQTQGWPTSPTPSNSHRILQARFSLCGSRHLGHSRMYWCVCVQSYLLCFITCTLCVHLVLPLCAVFSLHVVI